MSSTTTATATTTDNTWNPNAVDLNQVDPGVVICYLAASASSSNEQDSSDLAIRIIAIFTIGIVSTSVTLFPVLVARRQHLQHYKHGQQSQSQSRPQSHSKTASIFNLFARSFGAGVIIATAFIHLLDPAYQAIGPNSCVAMSGKWQNYPWCSAIVLISVMMIFLLHFGLERYMTMKYGSLGRRKNEGEKMGVEQPCCCCCLEEAAAATEARKKITKNNNNNKKVEEEKDSEEGILDKIITTAPPHQHQDCTTTTNDNEKTNTTLYDLENPTIVVGFTVTSHMSDDCSICQQDEDDDEEEGYKQQHQQQLQLQRQKKMQQQQRKIHITTFLILEMGIIFHSIIIGLNLGFITNNSQFNILFPVIVFHQSFEGLGIGSRMMTLCISPLFHTNSSNRKEEGGDQGARRTCWRQFQGTIYPWVLLCLAYGLSTPLAMAIGIALRLSITTSLSFNITSYYTSNAISGVLDALSAGILLYTGLVELLAKDFIMVFNRNATSRRSWANGQDDDENDDGVDDSKRMNFMLACLFMGIATMALLGKWA